MTDSLKVAIIYQASSSHTDSGADIACALKNLPKAVITPAKNPYIDKDTDWIFPDTAHGIEHAVNAGADCIWLDTVLSSDHPITTWLNRSIKVVGQHPMLSGMYNDKWNTLMLLKDNDIPVPEAELLQYDDFRQYKKRPRYPLVAKSIRGHHRDMIAIIRNREDFQEELTKMFDIDRHNSAVLLESFLPGEEIAVTVMPPGTYTIAGKSVVKENPWCLPGVKRLDHQNGVSPEINPATILHDTKVLNDKEENSMQVQAAYTYCIAAARLVGIRAPIQMDCRADATGVFSIIDLNMQPALTGPSRVHRRNVESLTGIAAQKIGWTYAELLENILAQNWGI
ncbi:MAG: carboxylate--amine ligase [Chitinophaga sp.]|uniref:carboxylate--amine ligase n=1 Tax=Chitinophaga sp. TaxID=1869181 RepID=UPI0025B9900C|nr:carboxylate--amine ligase [Chitinophaga sp.]MBV8253185.1 carboxylate--amine ligase [Chitinophaga sp.]